MAVLISTIRCSFIRRFFIYARRTSVGYRPLLTPPTASEPQMQRQFFRTRRSKSAPRLLILTFRDFEMRLHAIRCEDFEADESN
jgi:hypothetical protein